MTINEALEAYRILAESTGKRSQTWQSKASKASGGKPSRHHIVGVRVLPETGQQHEAHEQLNRRVHHVCRYPASVRWKR